MKLPDKDNKSFEANSPDSLQCSPLFMGRME